MSGDGDLAGVTPQEPTKAPAGEGFVHPETPLAEGRSVPGGDRPIAPSVQSSLRVEAVRRDGELAFIPTGDVAATLPPPGATLAVNLRVECSWCRKILHPGDLGAPISHGCCPTCSARMRAEAGLEGGV